MWVRALEENPVDKPVTVKSIFAQRWLGGLGPLWVLYVENVE